MGKCTERLYNGIVKENPTFVQMLGMCPTLAVTSAAINGAGGTYDHMYPGAQQLHDLSTQKGYT